VKFYPITRWHHRSTALCPPVQQFIGAKPRMSRAKDTLKPLIYRHQSMAIIPDLKFDLLNVKEVISKYFFWKMNLCLL
jgi:hypothetical protein